MRFSSAGDVAAFAAGVDGEVAERQPEFAHMAREGDGHDDGVGRFGRLLGEGDRLVVLDAEEAQIAASAEAPALSLRMRLSAVM